VINVQIVLKEGMLHKCSATGHAGFAKKGKDIVCASVTILLRTSIETFAKNDLLELQTKSFGRGDLFFCVWTKDASKEAQIILKYMADFLQNGFQRLCTEYPKCVSLDILAEV